MMQWYAIYRKADGFIDRKQNNAPDAFMAGLDAAVWGYLACAADLDVDRNKVANGAFVTVPLSQAELSIAVDTERDRRISLGFSWNGTLYQTRVGTQDLFNITSMGACAAAISASGYISTDYRWLWPDKDFTWTAADNSLVPMSVFDMASFAVAAAAWVSRITVAATAIKATASGIPSNYATDSRWPS